MPKKITTKKTTSKILKKKEISKSVKKKEQKTEENLKHYLEAIGRRKTAVARVRIWTKEKKGFLVNDKDYKLYFPTLELQQIVSDSFVKMNSFDRFGITVKVRGGGIMSQAEAVRHGGARVLVLFNQDYRKKLKKAGFLTRDPRMKERKKPGLKRARRAPQWRKR